MGKFRKNKWFALLLAVIMSALAVTGCGSASGTVSVSEDKEFDEINVGEIYYREVDEGHIAQTEDGLEYADNEILIVAADGTSKSEIEDLAAEYDAELVGYIEQTGDCQLLLSEPYTIDELDEIRAELESEEIVEGSSVNGIAEYSGDAVTEEQYGFYYGEKWQSDLQDPDDGKGKSWGLEVINTFYAWGQLAGSEYTEPVKLGLIDIGFDTDHEDLDFAETFYNDDFDPDVQESHGTHVAGIMAAGSSDSTGICGVYPYGDGNLYGVADGGSTEYGGISASEENGTFWTSVISQKTAYAELILRNVKVINQSQGFNVYINEFDGKDYDGVLEYWNTHDFSAEEALAAELGDFLNRLLQKGYDFVIVSSSGNDSDDSIGHLESRYNSWINMIDENDYPDVYNRIIVVGAVNRDMEICGYSNGGERVDIYAPGGEPVLFFESGNMIYSTVAENDYGYMAGTSMASPHVAGVAACVWAANNDLTGDQVKSIICSSISDNCTWCRMTDAGKAVHRAITLISGEESEDEDEGGEDKQETETEKYGGIMGWVANRYYEDIKVEGASVTAVNTVTGKTDTTITDSDGHFEFILEEGEYTLHVEAENYFDFDWPDDTVFETAAIEVKSEEITYPDEWILMKPEKISEINYYDSDGKMLFSEKYAYYDDLRLCSTTMYSVSYYSGDEGYLSEEYTYLYLYDDNGELSDTVFGSLTISDWYDENTGELILGYDYDADGNYVRSSVYPEKESIEQEKFGVDPSKTEVIYDRYPRVSMDSYSGCAEKYLEEIFDGGEPTDQTFCRLIYVNDDLVPELWIDYGYGYAGAEIYTYSENDEGYGSTDRIYLSHGTAQWIEGGNLLYVSGGHMGYYYDSIFYINNDGKFEIISSGEYELMMDEGDDDIYLHTWDGLAVTEDTYLQKLDEAFNSAKAEDICQNIYTYEQCRLLLEYFGGFKR